MLNRFEYDRRKREAKATPVVESPPIQAFVPRPYKKRIISTPSGTEKPVISAFGKTFDSYEAYEAYAETYQPTADKARGKEEAVSSCSSSSSVDSASSCKEGVIHELPVIDEQQVIDSEWPLGVIIVGTSEDRTEVWLWEGEPIHVVPILRMGASVVQGGAPTPNHLEGTGGATSVDMAPM